MESHNKKSFEVKLNPHITIYPVEEKMYNKQQMEDCFWAGVRKGQDGLLNQLREESNKVVEFEEWFETNIK